MGGRCSGVDEKSPTGYGYSLKGKCNKETSLKKNAKNKFPRITRSRCTFRTSCEEMES